MKKNNQLLDQTDGINKNIILSDEIDFLKAIIFKINPGAELSSFIEGVLLYLRNYLHVDDCSFVHVKDDVVIKIQKIVEKNSSLVSSFSEQVRIHTVNEESYRSGLDYAVLSIRVKKEIYLPDINLMEYPVNEKLETGSIITGLFYLPLSIGHSETGLLQIQNYQSPLHLTEEEKILIKKRAEIIEWGINQILLMKDMEKRNDIISLDLELSGRIQRNLLPQQIPVIPQVSIATEYIPMNEVGGDYYDFIELDQKKNEKFGILITDATGH